MGKINLKFSRIKKATGFTLVELMMVVVIIGILTAMAVPKFMLASVRSKQSEAKMLLKQIYTMQQAYIQLHETYALNGVDASNSAPLAYAIIGVEVGVPARYTYHTVSTLNTFTCTATANLDDDATNDVWTVDNTGTLANISNDVSN